MDKFFSGFNLQNLLRQFCCGVVFFVPLFLFVPVQFNYMWHRARIGEDKLVCVAVLSFIIGTIIYHLEKNLYSYLIQAFFESARTFLLLSVLIIFVLGVIGLCIVGCCLPTLIGIASVLLIIACIICFLIPIFSKDFNLKAADDPTDRIYCKVVDKLVDRTERCWRIEELANVGQGSCWCATAKKVSIWSDFIHCVQSCCFAWILGTIAAYYLHSFHSCGCDAAHCIHLYHMSVGVVIAMAILLVEIGIDAHRYIHVIRMTTPCVAKQPESGNPAPKPQSDKQ